MTSDTSASSSQDCVSTKGAAPSSDPRVLRSRAKILDAATHLLVESGARSVTVDGVAARAGVSKATLYRHWESRDALVADVVRRNMPQVAAPDEGLAFDEALRQIVLAMAHQAADPEWQRILPALFSLKHQLAEVELLADAEREEQTLVLARVLERGVEVGGLRPDLDPEVAALELIGPLILAALGTGGDLSVRIADHVVDDFLAAHGS